VSDGAVVLSGTPYVLSEGPVWQPDAGILSWIDIDDGLVLSAPFDGETLGPITTLHIGGSVGCALPISGGRYLVALEAWIGILHPDGRLEKSPALISTNRRFNDGKIDPQGRLVVGTLRRFGGTEHREHLLRLEPDGSLTVLDDAIGLGNGLGWSPDGGILYYADSADRVIYRRAYFADAVGERELFLQLEGMPDGFTVDRDGRLWITLLDLNRVDCFGPDGERIPGLTVELGTRHPASVEFAGPDLDRLVVTTGFPRLEDSFGEYRDAGDGAVLMARPSAVGLAPTQWREAPLPQRPVVRERIAHAE
jgi:sugar lactone lactonase YvrE